jgi:hypothetical protein
MTPDVAARLKAVKRASRLRAKVAKGTATPEEREELERTPPRTRGRPKKKGGDEHEAPPDQKAPAEETADSPVTQVEEGEVPPPPPPPTVEVVRPRKGEEDWRSRYRKDIGREAACLQIGTLYCGILKRLADYIEKQGSRPVFDSDAIDSMILPAAVLTADKLLPPGLSMGPEVELAVGSGILTVQAAVVASKKRKRAAPSGWTPPTSSDPPTPQPEEPRAGDNVPEPPKQAPAPNGRIPEGAVF